MSAYSRSLPDIEGDQLSRAIWAKDYSMVKLLIKHGADINEEDSIGKTAIMNAVSIKDEKMIRLILRYKPDLDRLYFIPGENPQTSTILTFAITTDSSLQVIKGLIRAGANVNFTEGEALYFPLLASIYHSRIDIMRLLLRKGADPNHYIISENIYMNAMYMIIGSAFKSDDIEAVEILMDSGFKIYADNEYVEYARNWGKPELARYLKKMVEELGPLEPWDGSEQ